MTERRNERHDWGTLNEVETGLYRLRLFNPRGALMINTWIYQGPTGFVVFDPGWPWTREGLASALGLLGTSVSAVKAWLYTHTHVDHMGLAAWLGTQSDAPHITWSGVEPHLENWHSFQDRTNDWSGWGRTAFDEPARSTMLKMWEDSRRGRPFKGLVDEFGEMSVRNAELFDFGQTIGVEDLALTVIDARGHDPHHIAFFENERGWLFSGDVILPAATPISRAMGDDLGAYESAIERLAVLNTQLLLPGHGIQRSDRIAQAFERSRGFVADFEASVWRVLESTPEPIDLFSLAIATTPDGKPPAASTTWWVHLSNLDSHLNRGVMRGDFVEFTGPRYALA